jgi:hypothetical protein
MFVFGLFHRRVQPLHPAVTEVRHGHLGHVRPRHAQELARGADEAAILRSRIVVIDEGSAVPFRYRLVLIDALLVMTVRGRLAWS